MRGAGRSGVGYYNAIVNPTRNQRDKQFRRQLAIGKETERRVDRELTSLGFKVLDISMRKMRDGRFLPFDLLATLPNDISIIIDVKRVGLGYYYKVYQHQFDKWRSFNVNAEKIVVFAMSGFPDSYIRISDIESSAKLVGKKKDIYTIPFQAVKSIDSICNEYI